MNIFKLLLIDTALVIAIIPLIFLLQGGNKKSTLLPTSNKEKQLRKTKVNLPDKEKILELEKITKDKGSGIDFYSLFGDWKFVSVWNQGRDEKDYIFSSLLKVFSANLKIKKEISTENSHKFSVITSIKFGFLSIEFSGSGHLKGKQPILTFFFKTIELKSGSNILLSRAFKEPVEKEKSYFALIAFDKSGGWLSARGQSGALVLWLKD
tara:strand:- start:436 stop:1062 length:627 start_codon:yes stop_codon:yes gene_type:complete